MNDQVQQFFEVSADRYPDRLCVVSNGISYSYADLERDSNKLANYLLNQQHIRVGERIGILLSPSYQSYVCILATLKANATFVPMDRSFPAERIQFICDDAEVKVLLTESALRHLTRHLSGMKILEIDSQHEALEHESADRPKGVSDAARLCYIIYTSGTTGKPKGVAINHGNYCNYLTVVPSIYGIRQDDRVYQGLTIAFDFSFDEIFPTFIAGAVLVTGSVDPSDRVGAGLAAFLAQQRITVFHSVPTLLATIDQDMPLLATIFLGGETCPRDLAQRWLKPNRRIFNTYGPTETTITASWVQLSPDKPVTIGKPLPTYRIDVRDEQLQLRKPGEPGEICIAGPCVAQGYINRPDQTELRFVNDPDQPDIRMYRTGDLGRIGENGEIEFMGRIDTQVKIRGYRIELAEIESVLLDDPDVANVLVNPWQGKRSEDVVELVAYLIAREGTVIDQSKNESLYRRLCQKLPKYMVPAYIEWLLEFPTLPSGKADRAQLPGPLSRRLATLSGVIEYAADECEEKIASVWGEAFGADAVCVNAHFFNDLGGHSLFAARVVSGLREVPGFEQLSIRDLYANPTVRQLAVFVSDKAKLPQHGIHETRLESMRLASNKQVWLAGIIQTAALFVLSALLSAPFIAYVQMKSLPTTFAGSLELVGVSVGLLFMMSLALPIAVKWAVIGRFKPGRYPLWGAYFLRFWLVQKVLHLVPWHLLCASLLVNGYLRLLGCSIGRGCHIGTQYFPGLVTLGDEVNIGYNVELTPYEISGGWLILTPIHLANGTFVGNGSVIDHGVRMKEGSGVGEQSMVPFRTTLPERTYWEGSPVCAQTSRPAALLQTSAARASESTWNIGLWTLATAVSVPMLYVLPLIATIPALWPIFAGIKGYGVTGFCAALIPAGLIYVLVNCTLLAFIKWLIEPKLAEGVYAVHSQQGFRKWFVDRLMAISLMVNNSLYATLYTKFWLRALGVKVGHSAEVSTLSFFDPSLLTLEDECFVADMASLGAATFHNGWFVIRPTRIGHRAFVGNGSLVPSGGVMEEGTLLGVMSKPNGERIEAGTSWLGAPAIFLPRRQIIEGFGEEKTFNPSKAMVAQRLFVEFFRVVLPSALFLGGLAVSIFAFRWFVVNETLALAYLVMPMLAIAVAVVLTLIVAALKWIVVGKYVTDIKPIWSHFVWRSELITGLYENVPSLVLLGWLTGTPMLAPFLRLFGVKIGSRLFCETTYLSEFDLVEIADDVSIGKSVSLQTHLFEDRIMKMAKLTIDSGVDIGVRSIILYDAHVRARARIGSLSLILKAEVIPANSNWEGIPAQRIA
ncbi:MAG: amino acid adenylation domain-containing protein [Proteobacteria bacterium]|nr:amino acid adenylation domain-containing protein [Pseudomonadota bacterium]